MELELLLSPEILHSIYLFCLPCFVIATLAIRLSMLFSALSSHFDFFEVPIDW